MQGVSPQEAKRLIDDGALLLDVREDAEWQAARIPGAQHLPLYSLPGRMDELPKDRPIVCQCAHGVRSAGAAHWLQRAGFTTYNLDGGIVAWHQAGLAIEEGAP